MTEPWINVDCGCRFRRNADRFEIEPCRLDCRTLVYAQEESARRGNPIRFEARRGH